MSGTTVVVGWHMKMNDLGPYVGDMFYLTLVASMINIILFNIFSNKIAKWLYENRRKEWPKLDEPVLHIFELGEGSGKSGEGVDIKYFFNDVDRPRKI